MFFKKILMPCGLCAAIPVIKPANPSQNNMASYSNESEVRKLTRPSELPIYLFEDDHSKQTPCTDCPPSTLEENIRKIRKSVRAVISEYQLYTGIMSDTIDTGFEHTILDYLREESNIMPRIGAIGIGGLSGLILGLRGRTFKRLIYSSIGALNMAAICYPKEAEKGFNMAKHYINVGFNFVYGVKPGDGRQLEIAMPELPKLKVPTSVSEFVELVIATGSAVTTAVGSSAQNAYAFLSNDKQDKQSAAKNVKQD